MRLLRIAAAAALALGLAACASRSGDETIAVYCSDPGRANQDLCKVHAEVEATRGDVRRNADAIAETRTIANQALNAAGEARLAADAAYSRQDGLHCVTRTVRRAQVGSCEAGYTLVGCSQSRYTTRSGGPTVIRNVDDTSCRFATRVLEMKLRCCHVGANAPTTQAEAEEAAPPPVS